MLLLTQSADIEINPGPIQRVIRGSFHQGDQRFQEMAGTQCMFNAFYSVGYSMIKKARHWTTWDMDYIVIAGNSLYGTLEFRAQWLSVDELPSLIPIKNILISITENKSGNRLKDEQSQAIVFTEQ